MARILCGVTEEGIVELIINSPKHGAHIVLYDDDDHELISKHKWYIHKPTKTGTFYAVTNIPCKTKRSRQTCLKMHRLILGNPNQLIDHRNSNGLDNRKINLRLCTPIENCRNANIRSNNKSGYKGVSKVHNLNRYRVVVYLRGEHKHQINGGCFSTKEEAAKRYNELAIKYYGEFAKLNPIP